MRPEQVPNRFSARRWQAVCKEATMFHRVIPPVWVILLSVALVFTNAETGKENAPAKDSAEKDYSAELPRIPPKTPAESLKCVQLWPGFRIELVAAEPLVQSPVAIDFDEDGRMFVVEYPEYNQYANKNYQGHGRVCLLEDTDGDGRYDKRTVYVDNLRTPTAVA